MAWRELWLPSDVELKRLLKASLHVLAVSMRACMHGIVACVNAGGCAIITLAVAGVADLLACMDALLRACMHSCMRVAGRAAW